ncbi:MAG: hypothetical protein OK456_03220 [Thaumarchaeota archaeon]|nr:hypothetical protein [Nitrososphaerota archaeon]
MLKVPGKPRVYTRGRISKGSGTMILQQPLLKATVKLSALIADLDERWAIGGDVGELLLGVDVKADHLEIVTTRKGSEAIGAKFQQLSVPSTSEVQDGSANLGAKETEKKLERLADCSGNLYAVSVRSHYVEVVLDGIRVEVYGDLQYRVGELEWGDPVVFEPTEVSIVGTSLRVFPLGLKSEIYLALGWVDRVDKISEALMRSQPTSRTG